MLESSLCLSLSHCDEIRTPSSTNKTAGMMFLLHLVSADDRLKCLPAIGVLNYVMYYVVRALITARAVQLCVKLVKSFFFFSQSHCAISSLDFGVKNGSRTI